ncbi:hypothetical protein SJI00_20745 [Pseudomonas sp. RP23018S]|uniref:hypothetical protein n=1 Tax=Pseudomonas sp. RP23018S TaxID=3096037 RepID=UPI002ACA0006|nr:hypothetical protein [Pseudomonas sp. RP23018S]MDZ5605204.1 hypothetical protein [Pseudomonas sp. RP23018S]
MSQSPEADPFRSKMLEEVFKAGKKAASHSRPDLATAQFAAQHPGDRALVHEFMRGMNSQKAGIRSYEGVLVEHGQAKYNHDPRAKMSYYVTLDTPTGHKTVWGIDLERAMGLSDTQVGDPVHIAYEGAKAVEVDLDVLDDNGNVIGARRMQTSRNMWLVTKIDAADLANRQSAFSLPHTGGGSQVRSPSVMSSLFGSEGLSGLKRMLSFGGDRVSVKVADFSEQRATLDLHDALKQAKTTVAALNESGLSAMSHGSMGREAKDALLRHFLADPKNREQVFSLSNQINKVGNLSEVVIGKAALRCRDEEAIDNQILKPIRDFKEQNEKLLKALSVDDRSLYDRLDGVLKQLTKFLGELLDRIRGGLGLGSGQQLQSGPGSGPCSSGG